MRFRDFLLVALLVLAGFFFYQVKTGHWDIGWVWDWDEGFGPFTREVTVEETRTIEAPLPPALEIENGRGWVEVRGSDRDDVQLTFKKVVRRRTEEEARDVADRIELVQTATTDKMTLATNRDEFRRKNFETGFILTVPRAMRLAIANAYGTVRVEGVREAEVRNRHGEVFAADIEGPCRLETGYEAVEVQNVSGTCRVVSRHGAVRAVSIGGGLWVEASYDKVRVEDAAGPVDVRGSYADVDVRRVAGTVDIDTSYEKVVLSDVGAAKVMARHSSVTAEDVRGDLEVRTSYETVRARRIKGRLRIEANNAAVEAEAVGGTEISIATSYEPVTVADFSARLQVSCRHGHVTLRPRDLKHGMDVRNEYGEIVLIWPSGEVARLEARSKGGSVSWGLSQRPDVEESNGVSLLKAYSASSDAALITLATSYDNIRIAEGSRRF